MHIDNAHIRLKSLWGLIDRQHNELIEERLVGSRILDVGCGYGSLVAYLTERGYSAQGVDYDAESVRIAQNIFPEVPVQLTQAEDLAEFPNSSFDSIVLKDCMHHLVGEGDVKKSFQNFKRVLVPSGRIVILDPNPTIILRTARKLAAHVDFESSLQCTLDILEGSGFVVRSISFYETVGLPLSGGYVGYRLVPAFKPIERAVAGLNRAISSVVNAMHLGKALCWRYIVHADAA